ncbi:MAG TPA: hypothetical protein DDX39_04430 [Bacteroidales bacterium]|nr:MAG: hypothetical protein A2W98_10570 [Bacteroidetes bacterium GWF2_33_38]OFY70812.1 MAG: hypothetical protein A2265_04290 [Bacteroidetes bacterium RIFOXYA12_FULL_33_9]HBF87870.1 hypothetical protein [Bacteroidales bacterium]
MKKIIPILFVFILLFYSFGYFIVFKSIQYSIRKEIKLLTRQHVDVNSLECFEFEQSYLDNPDNDFRWVKVKEFRYKGKLYDILKTEKTQNQVKLYCINDTDEEMLVDNFLKYSDDLANTNVPQKQSKQRTLKLLKIVAIVGLHDTNTLFNISDEINIHSIAFLDDIFAKQITPPPKQFSFSV